MKISGDQEAAITTYSLGDLGNVASIGGRQGVEEGDCRYMAQELLQEPVDTELLASADIFSLGLSLWEAAGLAELPRNSQETELNHQMYESLKQGELPGLEHYSEGFNSLLKWCVAREAGERPTARQVQVRARHLLEQAKLN